MNAFQSMLAVAIKLGLPDRPDAEQLARLGLWLKNRGDGPFAWCLRARGTSAMERAGEVDAMALAFPDAAWFWWDGAKMTEHSTSEIKALLSARMAA